jgi:hypothetical protein
MFIFNETFEFLPKLGKSSFLRKQESSHLRGFIDSRFRGNDKEGRFSKLSILSWPTGHYPGLQQIRHLAVAD